MDVGNNGLTNNELARLGTLYTGVLNGFIDASLGKRPVYVIFGDTDSETQQILTAHQQALVPDGLGFRVSTGPTDRATTDPGFDLRGLTSEPTPLDEVAYSVIWMYPRALAADRRLPERERAERGRQGAGGALAGASATTGALRRQPPVAAPPALGAPV